MSRVFKKDRGFIAELAQKDEIFDSSLRPTNWDEFIGQEKVKENIRVMIEAAKKRSQPPDHMLFYGNSGLGKTSLAYLIAKEINSPIKTVSAPAIGKPGDLAAILTNLEKGSILFIDECHRLSKVIEEYLYPAIEDFKLHLILGRGPMAQTAEIPLNPFTLIGATTKIGLVSAPLRNRFGAIFKLDFYEIEDIKKILERSAKILNVKISPSAIEIIASSSRFTPRIANRLLKRVRDFSEVKGKGFITEEIAREALEFLEIDEIGLEKGDINLLKTIIEKFRGGPVGLKTLALSSSEEEETILEVYEPYLIKMGFLERTPKGRVVTSLALKHLRKKGVINKLV
jgi:Holliday junction DNA helicase RuvB